MNAQAVAGNPLPRSTPEAQGVSSAGILAFVEAVEKNIRELHSLMLLRHGNVITEGWWQPYRPSGPHNLFSLSKSFTATAIGLAIGEGILSLDDPVLSFFPDQAPANPDVNLARLRLRHLLTMSTGHSQDTLARLRNRPDGKWIQGFFELPLDHEPGTHFVYNTGATYLLSAILQKLTGQTLLDYLRPRLFEPLGIDQPTWETSSEGFNFGGWGLSIRSEDLARFGQLYLQKGHWQGRRILSETWVESATFRQIATGANPDSDREQGYGYQFWRGRHGSYRGEGGFGQFCLVLPEQDAVLAITGAVEGDMYAVLDLVWKYLFPALAADELPENPAARADLFRKLDGLKLDPPQGGSSTPMAMDVSGKTYRMEPNVLKIEAFNFDFGAAQSRLVLQMPVGNQVITAGNSAWIEGRMGANGAGGQPVVCSGAWTAVDTYVLTIRYYETAHYDTHTFTFEQDRIRVSGGVNVSLDSTQYPPMQGRQI
ncbi:MAG: serine hydrolase [Anaerolineaceae bacterium]|nr:serine hydrolase [Anaerolineaceae bacterium]